MKSSDATAMMATRISPSATLTPGLRLDVIYKSGGWLAYLSSEVTINNFLPDRALLEVRPQDRPGDVITHRAAQVEATLRRVVEIPQEGKAHEAPLLHLGEGLIGEVGLIGQRII